MSESDLASESDLVHRLNNHLCIIVGFCDLLLLEHGGKKGELSQYLGLISESSRSLLNIINDILDLSKIEAKTLDVRVEAVNPDRLLDLVVELWQQRMTTKGLTLLRHPTIGPAHSFYSDPLRLRQILDNLISNASKFTAQGTIELHLENHPDDIEFRVTDNGPGIPPAVRDFGPNLTYIATTSPRSSVLVTPTATVADLDTTDFNNAKLTFATTVNVQPYDTFSVSNSVQGCCNSAGPSILYNSVIVGIETGGIGMTPLVITFNSNATVEAIQAVLQSVSWVSIQSNGAAPNSNTRTIAVKFEDGDGGTSNISTKAIDVNVTQFSPLVYKLGRSQTYSIGSPGVLVAAVAVVTTPFTDTNFNGGKLTITTTLNGEATDRYFFRPQGNGPGQINVVGLKII